MKTRNARTRNARTRNARTRNQKTRRRRNKTSNRRRDTVYGGFNYKDLIKLLISGQVFLTKVPGSCGTKYYMTACAGNTCRSPQAEYKINSLLDGKSDSAVFSRGTKVRIPNTEMAPLSAQIANDLCNGNETCEKKVKAHASKSVNCKEIKDIISQGHTLQIIPMDDMVADQISSLLHDTCEFDSSELSKINVGLECKDNVCKHKSAGIPDPFFLKDTPFKSQAYANTSQIMSDVIENEFQKCSINPMRWKANKVDNTISKLNPKETIDMMSENKFFDMFI